ncbi:MAG TPA: glycosyltransferase family 4 protein [Longimicrobium sp.]|nr:glycosyltransferase family 4 protein [Longimicrobium sp.]
MKVAFLSASGQVGGAERVLLDLAASLRQAEPGWEMHLVTAAEGPLGDAAARLGITVHLLPFPPALARVGDAGSSAGGSRAGLPRALVLAAPGAAWWTARLRRLLGRIGPEVVHSHGFKVHVLGALGLPRGVRLVWHVHDYVSGRRVMAGAMRRVAGRASVALAVSDSVAADVRAACPGLRVSTVRNAIDLARFSPEGDRLDLDGLARMPPAPAGTVRVGLVATMGLWKGHEVFLRAVAALDRDLPVRAYVVGGAIYGTAGSEVDPGRLRRLASELGIGDRVGFTGFADAAAAMRALDVVVHASTQPEPFGLVIAEAMACARPVVVSAAGGAGEIITDGRDALGVPPGNVEAMAEAIRRLVVDPDLRARMGAAGRETAERAFDRARLAAEVAPVYRSLVGGSDGSGSVRRVSVREISDRKNSDRPGLDGSRSGGSDVG